MPYRTPDEPPRWRQDLDVLDRNARILGLWVVVLAFGGLCILFIHKTMIDGLAERLDAMASSPRMLFKEAKPEEPVAIPEATPEEQEEYARTCETVCVTSGMWPIAAHREVWMSGWSTCTCIESEPGRERPRVVVFQGAHFERSEVLFEGRPPTPGMGGAP